MEVYKHIKSILFFLVIVNFNSILFCQETRELEDSYSYELLLPDLEVLVEAAWEQHGMVKMREKQIEASTYNLAGKKQNWLRGAGFRANYNYGTTANVSENTAGGSAINLATNSIQETYGLGFFFNLTAFEVVNRKSAIRQAEVEIQMAEDFLEFQKFEVKQLVTAQYEDLLLKQELLELAIRNLVDAKISQQLAEKEYRNGLIPIYEFVRLSDITSSKESEYLNAKSGLVLSKRLLENLTGLYFN
jgi:outer membrane protein TolC